MPAFTRSTIRLRSSSAMAPTMTAMARPSGPPVSMFSRKLTNSTLRRFKSSRISRKCFTDRATRFERPDQHDVEPPAPGVGHKPIETGSLRPRSADRVGVLAEDFVSASRRQGGQIAKLRLGMLVNAGNTDVKCGSLSSCQALLIQVLATLLVSEVRSRGGHIPENQVRRFPRGGSSPTALRASRALSLRRAAKPIHGVKADGRFRTQKVQPRPDLVEQQLPDLAIRQFGELPF